MVLVGRQAGNRWCARARRVAAPALLAMALLAFGAPAVETPAGAQTRVSQYDLEAVYVFDFAKFVRWPTPPSDGTFDFCVAAGQKGFAESLKKTVAGETLDGKPLRVRTVERLDEEAGCDILFLDGQVKNMPALMGAAAGKPMLTVSDAPDFLATGGMIQFVMVDSKVRFSVNLMPVGRSGLTMNAELLKVALKVQGSLASGGAQ